MRRIWLNLFIMGQNGVLFCEHGKKPGGSIQGSNLVTIWDCITFWRNSLHQEPASSFSSFGTQTQPNGGPLAENWCYFSTDDVCTLLLPLRQYISIGAIQKRIKYNLTCTDTTINNRFTSSNLRDPLHSICFSFHCEYNPSTSNTVNWSEFTWRMQIDVPCLADKQRRHNTALKMGFNFALCLKLCKFVIFRFQLFWCE
jgi:hypothetical protein